jgi:hypothetical protein
VVHLWITSIKTKPQAFEIGVGVASNYFVINNEKVARVKTKTVTVKCFGE